VSGSCRRRDELGLLDRLCLDRRDGRKSVRSTAALDPRPRADDAVGRPTDSSHLAQKGERGHGRQTAGDERSANGARFAEGAGQVIDTGRVLGTFNFGAGASALRDTITDAWKRGKRDLVGLSIDANGTAGFALREAKRVRVAKSITKVNSVDLIVDPSAGGALVLLALAGNEVSAFRRKPV